MLVHSGPINPLYDSFIIGSGPAGLTVALELAKAGKKVLVFESGLEDQARGDLPVPVNHGHLPDSWWVRHSVQMLGGTSAVWGGWCASLAEEDFQRAAAGVSWPIRLADLLPYYRRAAGALDRAESIVGFELPFVPGFVYRPFSVQEDKPTRFKTKHDQVLRGSAGVDVALGFSVTGLDANDARTAVQTIRYQQHDTGAKRRLAVSASQTVVVAAGGIGNAQLLLQPREDGAVPVGNESGLAGRFLMEHPHFIDVAECVLDENLDARQRPGDFGTAVHAMVPTGANERLSASLACSVDFQQMRTDHPMAGYLSKTIGKPAYHYTCIVRSEMRPSPNNRVYITPERNAAGFYRAGVRCVFDAEDYLTTEATLRALGETLIAENRGRIRINNDRLYHDVTGGGHLMGTTRMGRTRSDSVVDADCRVHGYDNLFVAGSSVFPTGGYANPTLTIVALSLRLAERLVAGR